MTQQTLTPHVLAHHLHADTTPATRTAPTVAPAAPAAPTPIVEVRPAGPAPTHRVEFVLDGPAVNEATIALAAARADVVRLVPSAVLPTPMALRAMVATMEDEIEAVGRDRAAVRIVLDVETVLTADDTEAHRRRAALAHVEAFTSLTWAPSATRLVGTFEDVVDQARELGRRTGVDAVVLDVLG
ncbi:LLM class flavin-dependent oxidoreductase [Cellulomonas bogoriensis]|uniref:Uncharacterized protein n=1 Tax=Cellulomonas bogoriensis 69B4 = DSM 16987 TaxID=1386082 RepID=A0A0A0BVM8_9CELL|nr:LLM class flavin-dependent oxidoreductase [Cellulomonas bogoriensis]KGM12035.1 hypothetical protein N869_02175 [Cellulomonas bogoriensis 69B4 = DSM 16987]